VELTTMSRVDRVIIVRSHDMLDRLSVGSIVDMPVQRPRSRTSHSCQHYRSSTKFWWHHHPPQEHRRFALVARAKVVAPHY
jgi:hypothetical protein